MPDARFAIYAPGAQLYSALVLAFCLGTSQAAERLDAPAWLELQQLAAYQIQHGDYQAAEQQLQQALRLARHTENAHQLAVTSGALGNVYIALKRPSLAEQHLQQSAQQLRTLNAPLELARVLNNLGNYYTFRQNLPRARQHFQESTALAKTQNASTLTAQSLANLARITLEAGDSQQAADYTHQAWRHSQALPAGRNQAFIWIHLAGTISRLPPAHITALASRQLFAYDLLRHAAESAETLDDSFTASYAWRHLGERYERAGRHREALQLTQKALFQAQQSEINRAYLQLHGYWQAGRQQQALGERVTAIDSYRIAVRLLQKNRYQLNHAYRLDTLSFRESSGALYFELADLLLQQADTLQNPARLDVVLREVRDIIEWSKAAELRNYFDDECVDALKARSKQADTISPSAVVIYPIVLPQRLELLITRAEAPIRRYTVAVSRAELTQQVRLLRRLLEKRTTYQYRKPARTLYRWLIEPLLADLGEQAADTIDTLVFVPDGPLRSVPMAALFDGQQHLLAQYAVVTTPGIELTDPQPLSRQAIRAAAAGLSEPVAGFPALAAVQGELQMVHGLYGGHILLNEHFIQTHLQKTLTDPHLNILHIATHGQFKANAEDSFLLTYDGRVTLNQLADYIGLFKFRQTPLELLVLSACETAQGDDRAALGLSGIAIKAGARSAIGSLWQVNDVATAELMQAFYQRIQRPGTSRAQALQQAQLQLQTSLRYRHPAYWSAFLLMNSWL